MNKQTRRMKYTVGRRRRFEVRNVSCRNADRCGRRDKQYKRTTDVTGVRHTQIKQRRGASAGGGTRTRESYKPVPKTVLPIDFSRKRDWSAAVTVAATETLGPITINLNTAFGTPPAVGNPRRYRPPRDICGRP